MKVYTDFVCRLCRDGRKVPLNHFKICAWMNPYVHEKYVCGTRTTPNGHIWRCDHDGRYLADLRETVTHGNFQAFQEWKLERRIQEYSCLGETCGFRERPHTGKTTMISGLILVRRHRAEITCWSETKVFGTGLLKIEAKWETFHWAGNWCCRHRVSGSISDKNKLIASAAINSVRPHEGRLGN